MKNNNNNNNNINISKTTDSPRKSRARDSFIDLQLEDEMGVDDSSEDEEGGKGLLGKIKPKNKRNRNKKKGNTQQMEEQKLQVFIPSTFNHSSTHPFTHLLPLSSLL